MRTLALDVGSKTIGVAVTDPMGWTAQGVDTIRRSEIAKDLRQVVAFVREYEVKKIVIGLPLDTQGEVGPQAKKVLAFKKKLDAYLLSDGLSVLTETWDESMTTVEAEEILLGADVSRAKRKQVIDKLAAVMILKSYMEASKP